ncbi:hypothetical protein L0337_27270 [candidate division KSB1 bacterium]|nr:hypothetical protein [candidate division KSB1 bacterium]
MFMRSRWWILSFLFLLVACEDLERGNPLDPNNPSSERRRVVFVEAFVNDTAPFSDFALRALDSLAVTFSPQQVVIVEHHLPSAKFADAEALPESDNRYRLLTAADPAVPDIFFNGSQSRVQGASTTGAAVFRYRHAIQAEIDKVAHFTIEAQKTISANRIDIDVTVARLGKDGFSQFAVTAMIAEDLGAAGHHHVARKILLPESFSGIAAGERKSVHFTTSLPSAVNTGRIQAVVMVEQTTDIAREILQTTLAE